MTQEDKELLLKDLCARLPFGVKVKTEGDNEPYILLSVHPNKDIALIGMDMGGVYATSKAKIDIVKPYLRPMSSMTEEEFDDMFKQIFQAQEEFFRNCSNVDTIGKVIANDIVKYDWLNKHHFDYRGLIPKGLALEAPNDMYKKCI